MDLEKEAYKISMFGEFVDRDLEQEFFNDNMARNIKYIRPIVLIFGILYMLFIIPDYFCIADRGTLLGILANRSVFLILVVVFLFATSNLKNLSVLAYWITAYEILGSISFLVIFSQYQTPNFLIHAFGVIVMISVIFITPNKWLHMIIAAVFVSIAFLVFSRQAINEILLSEYSAGVVYIFIVMVLSSINSFKSNHYMRKQYVYSKELVQLSTIDQLTGIYNRYKWNIELERWIAYSKRYKTMLSAIFFDIDNLKDVNDTFGHQAGDQVIIHITGIVRDAIRECDVFARWGGDEFMLLLPNTDMQQAFILAERLRISVADHRFEEVGTVTCSFGLVTVNKYDSGDLLVKHIDHLLYQAKMEGKNRVIR